MPTLFALEPLELEVDLVDIDECEVSWRQLSFVLSSLPILCSFSLADQRSDPWIPIKNDPRRTGRRPSAECRFFSLFLEVESDRGQHSQPRRPRAFDNRNCELYGLRRNTLSVEELAESVHIIRPQPEHVELLQNWKTFRMAAREGFAAFEAEIFAPQANTTAKQLNDL